MSESALAMDVQAYRSEIAQQNELIRQLQDKLLRQGSQIRSLERELFTLSFEKEQQQQRQVAATRLFERAPLASVILDAHMQILDMNRQAERFFDHKREHLVRRSFRSLLSRDAFRRFSSDMSALRADEQDSRYSQFLELANRTPFSMVLARLDEDRFYGVIQDLSVAAIAQNSERLAHFALEQLREGVIITDPKGVILKVNHAFTEISGYTPDEAIGKTPALLHSGRHSPRFYEQMWARLARHGWWAGEVWNRRKSGEIYPEWLQINRIVEPVTHQLFYVATFSDITEKKQHQKSLDKLAHYDSLTGLPNRRFFERALENHLHRARDNEAHKQAILFIDLDKFKEVNDRYGHQEGDLVLKEAAQRITASVRDTDIVSRIGGDEFVLMLPRLQDEAAARTIAAKLTHALAMTYDVNGRQHRLSASVGIALYPDHGDSVEDLMRRADAAMYQAKEKGKNQWALFDYADEANLLILDEKKRLIWSAIEDPEGFLDMHYQPIFCGQADARITELEALLRIQDQARHEIRTDEFIALAEESRLMVPLGESIFHATCQFARRLHDAGLSVPVTVNLSAEQFYDPNLLGSLESIAERQGLTLDRFNFEITETATMHNIDMMRDTLGALREKGARVLLDDFGTGYASLSQLHDLPVDILKLDRSFVNGISVNPTAESLVRAMLAMARALQLRVIAEGVETENQARWLRTERADCMQGYLLSRPLSADVMFAKLRDNG
ncbi:MAG: putative bifunctional diguanylate cyclase/phosphodiesterase [Halothiobacillaceae bacterium]